MDISKEHKDHEEKAAQYGSYENYLVKMELLADDAGVRGAYREAQSRYVDEEKLIEAIRATPVWMDPVQLSQLPLALIGAPEGSEEYEHIASGKNLRANRTRPSEYETTPRNAFTKDYTIEGWPKSAGKAWRYVTPEEDREIIQRLTAGGLTRPGSDVQLRGETLAQMVEDNEPTPGWLIEGLLRRSGAAMVFGPSGVGKTWLTHTLMLLAAAGHGVGVRSEATGKYVLQAGDHNGVRVGLLDGEMTRGDLTQRTKDLCGVLGLRMAGSLQFEPDYDLERLKVVLVANGEPETEEIIDTLASNAKGREGQRGGWNFYQEGDGPSVDLSNVVVYAKAAQSHRAEFPDIADTDWRVQIIEWCQREGVELLVLDNLTTLTDSLEDENSAADWSPLNALVVGLKEAGVATLLVHHANKTGGDYRGSTAIATTLETIVKLDALRGPQAKGGAGFQVTLTKNRANGRPEVDGKTLLLRDGAWRVEVDEFERAAHVVEMVKTLRYRTQQELADELGVDQSAVSRIFTVAEAQGMGLAKGELKAMLVKARRLAADMQRAGPEVVEADGVEPEVAALDI